MSGVYQSGQYSQSSQNPMPMHTAGQPHQQGRMYQHHQRPPDGTLPTTQPTHPNNSSQPVQQGRMYQHHQRPLDGILPTTQPMHPSSSSQPGMMGSMPGPAGYPHSSTMQQHQPQADGRQRATPTSQYYQNRHGLSQQQDLQPQPSPYSQKQDISSDGYGNYRHVPSPATTAPEGIQMIPIYTTEIHA